tara:strand:- start:8254 stop:9249 length:996 start_codon:yes stop_codon:yes gene_type:complete
MPVTASLIAAGIGGAQSAFGAYQYLKGRQLAKTAKRPEMNIPRDMYNKLTTAQQMAMEGMSEQERKQYIDNLQRVSNFQMQEMGTRKAGLVGAAELGQTQADALTNMAVESEKLRRENQMYLGQTQSEMAGWKQQQFMANKMAPYMATVTAANAMQGSGLQNIMGGAGSAAKNIGAAGIYSGLNKPNTISDKPKLDIKFQPGSPTDAEIAQQRIDLGGTTNQAPMTDEQVRLSLGGTNTDVNNMSIGETQNMFQNPSLTSQNQAASIAQSIQQEQQSRMGSAADMYMKNQKMGQTDNNYLSKYLDSVYAKMNSRQPLTAEEEKFMAYYHKK